MNRCWLILIRLSGTREGEAEPHVFEELIGKRQSRRGGASYLYGGGSESQRLSARNAAEPLLRP
jgi:hypothetical protein